MSGGTCAGCVLDSHAPYGIWYATSPVLARRRPAALTAWPCAANHARLASMNDISKGDGAPPGRRRAAPFPRGRVLRQEEAAAVKALLGDLPRERALLIEYLHLIQDREGCLPEGHLHALAEELKLPMAEVYEVATFYAHFDVVAANEPRPEKITVRVCDSLSCMLAG